MEKENGESQEDNRNLKISQIEESPRAEQIVEDLTLASTSAGEETAMGGSPGNKEILMELKKDDATVQVEDTTIIKERGVEKAEVNPYEQGARAEDLGATNQQIFQALQSMQQQLNNLNNVVVGMAEQNQQAPPVNGPPPLGQLALNDPQGQSAMGSPPGRAQSLEPQAPIAHSSSGSSQVDPPAMGSPSLGPSNAPQSDPDLASGSLLREGLDDPVSNPEPIVAPPQDVDAPAVSSRRSAVPRNNRCNPF